MKRSYHWGELDPSLGVGASASLIVPSSLFTKESQEVTIEGPKLTQPSAQQKTQIQLLPAELYRPDVISLHTIQLLKFNNSIISSASPHHHGDNHGGMQSEPSMEELVKKHILPEQTKIDDNGRLPQYSLSDGTVELDRSAARKLSHRAVSTVCAHSGYQTGEELAIETLTDVLNDYLTKICQLLRVAIDGEATSGSTGFQDTLTQVLHEVGVESPMTLYTFWKKRIKNYHQVMAKRTKALQSRIQRRRQNAIAVTSKCSLSSEDEMPSQIFAETNFKPASTGSTNGASSTADGEEEGNWCGSSSMETDQLENSGGGGGGVDNDQEQQCDDEVVDSGSYTDSSSQIADMGSTSPWEGYQDTPPPKKKKK